MKDDALTNYILSLAARLQQDIPIDKGQELILLGGALTNTIIAQLQDHLGLLFSAEPAEGNTCYASHNKEMRDDFKLFFETADLLHCLLASFCYDSRFVEEDDVWRAGVPKDKFWERVREGQRV